MLLIPKFGCYLSLAFALIFFTKFGVPVFNTSFSVFYISGGSKVEGGARDARPLSTLGPNSFFSHALLGKKF